MMAASPLSPSSSSASSVNIFRDKAFRRSSSLPPLRTSRIPKASASCAFATEREREKADGHRYYHYSPGCSDDGGVGTGRGGTIMAETLYDVLEVGAGATAQEIKAAYRRLARACHPDVVRADRRGGGGSAAEFMRIHAAYATLSDPDKRAEYDRRVVTTLAMRRRPPFGWESSSSASFYSPASPGSSSPSSRYRQKTWETDQCW